jgi:EmrB/QacA subfamily drug resistance transporter
MTRGGEPPSPAEGADPRRWRALMVTLTGGFMVLLDVTIVTIAVPSIQRGLGAAATDVLWVVSGYPLMFGLALVAGGRLGDTLGRRRMLLISLAGFVLTSALAGAAPTLTLLIVARLLQGLAGGLLTPQNAGLIQDLFRGAERGRAFGLLGTTIGLSTAVGPVLGGLIIAAFGEEHGWRWVFFVNVPVGAIALVLAARLVPRTERRAGRMEIDLPGVALLGLAVVCVLFPVVRADSGGLRRFWWLFPLAVPLLAAFVWWERRQVARARPPALDFRLFTGATGFRSGAVLASVYFSGFSGVWLVFALYFQLELGLSALETALVVTPFALGSAASSALTGWAVDRWGRWVTVVGLIIVTVGFAVITLVLWLVPADEVALAVLVPLLVAGIGGGAVIAPNTTLTLANVPARMSGVASAVIQTGQRMGTALGTALLAAVLHTVGIAAALLCAVVLVLVALGLAVRELIVANRGRGGRDDLRARGTSPSARATTGT